MTYLQYYPSSFQTAILSSLNRNQGPQHEEMLVCGGVKRTIETAITENQPLSESSTSESRTLPFKKRRFDVSKEENPSSLTEKPLSSQPVKASPDANSIVLNMSHEETNDRMISRREQNSNSPDDGIKNAHKAESSQQQGEGGLPKPSVPTGCHGRTTRTDTFCQRKPCYKGSKYCKLHYQQYVVFRIRSDQPASLLRQSGSSSESVNEVVSTNHKDTAAPASQERPKKLKYHDKCFTTSSTATDFSRIVGSPLSEQGALRCHATTSRGHSCAYVAVHNTKYCFMHADYDTNPPRRRRPREALKPKSITMMPGGLDSVALAPQMLPFSADPMHRLTLAPSSLVSMNLSFQQGVQQGHPSSLFMHPSWGLSKQGQNETTMVFLSQLSKKEWYGIQVTILAGPFMYRSGIVEKWGNGWVSVRVANVHGHESQRDSEGQPEDVVGGGPPGTILHNRRAFELCLLQPKRNASQMGIPSHWSGSSGSLLVS